MQATQNQKPATTSQYKAAVRYKALENATKCN
jgi:hypothetical protein